MPSNSSNCPGALLGVCTTEARRRASRGTAERKEEEENVSMACEEEADEEDVGDQVGRRGRRGTDAEDAGPKILEGDSTSQEDTDAERWQAATLCRKEPGAEETPSESKDREEELGAVEEPKGVETSPRPSQAPGGVWLHKLRSHFRRGICLEKKGEVASEGYGIEEGRLTTHSRSADGGTAGPARRRQNLWQKEQSIRKKSVGGEHQEKKVSLIQTVN
ncbi:hypothetical protein NDU88_001931 [Pleurodeles waltl]|uniref:Uncharacterized protein n=1 Tax=Pleurodeles waltl TaxID=8319 RepID=A0AAV7NG71_PLEWA|nr:hypothetical protein NDU88_001931 [Pleurodeles waltl]